MSIALLMRIEALEKQVKALEERLAEGLAPADAAPKAVARQTRRASARR
jgi:hypothetical protein